MSRIWNLSDGVSCSIFSKVGHVSGNEKYECVRVKVLMSNFPESSNSRRTPPVPQSSISLSPSFQSSSFGNQLIRRRGPPACVFLHLFRFILFLFSKVRLNAVSSIVPAQWSQAPRLQILPHCPFYPPTSLPAIHKLPSSPIAATSPGQLIQHLPKILMVLILPTSLTVGSAIS